MATFQQHWRIRLVTCLLMRNWTHERGVILILFRQLHDHGKIRIVPFPFRTVPVCVIRSSVKMCKFFSDVSTYSLSRTTFLNFFNVGMTRTPACTAVRSGQRCGMFKTLHAHFSISSPIRVHVASSCLLSRSSFRNSRDVIKCCILSEA